MTAKAKAKAEKPQETTGRTLAVDELLMHPAIHAAVNMKDYGGIFGAVEIQALAVAIRTETAKIAAGDMKPVEAMLYAQSKSLETIFTHLSRRSFLNMGEGYTAAADTYMRLALKAQSQCRTTLEALAEVKNPRPVAFVKQANIANGPQQVNNGLAQGKSEILKNKLLEGDRGDSLELGTQGAAGDRHPALETVGTLDRAA